MIEPALERAGAVERAIKGLLSDCRKDGALYVANPRAVAQVNRTGKWLLNALCRLRRELRSGGNKTAS